MKKSVVVISILLILLSAGIGVFLFRNNIPFIASFLSTTNWKFEKTISEPITATATTKEKTVLGDVAKNKISIEIPKDALDASTKLTLTNPQTVPNVHTSEIAPIGAPIEISAGKPTRLNDGATITFAYDTTKLPANTNPASIRVAYFDGTGWEYIKPVNVASDTGKITFQTFHFSLFGPTVITDENVIAAKWVHDKAVGNKLTGQLNGTNDKVSEKIITLTLEKMNITDKATAEKVKSALYSDPSYNQLEVYAGKGDPTERNKKIALIVGEKIAENVPKVVFDGMAKHVGEVPEAVASFSQAAGYATEGNYKKAAELIGEEITNHFIAGKAAIIATKVVNYEINSWKNSEVEAAYLAYKNGANGYFYGYNVDKGDFNSVWDQMRGVRRQLEINAIEKENEGRKEAGLPPLSEPQEDEIKESIKQTYQKQFEFRVKQEAQFADEETKLKKLVDAFTKADFFSSTAPKDLDRGLDYENKLDVLYHFAQKMMKDTNRPELSDKNGLVMDKAIAIDDIVQGARMWFSGADGQKQYAKFLQDRFNISMYPKLSDLSGEWNGTLVITSIDIPDDLKKQAAEGKKDENGCDFAIDPATLIGKENPLSFTITATNDTTGTILFSSKDSSGQNVPFTYADGQIKATMSEKGATAIITLPIAKEDSGYSTQGTLTATYAEGKVKLGARIHAVKGPAQNTSPTPNAQTSPTGAPSTPGSTPSTAATNQPTTAPTVVPAENR